MGRGLWGVSERVEKERRGRERGSWKRRAQIMAMRERRGENLAIWVLDMEREIDLERVFGIGMGSVRKGVEKGRLVEEEEVSVVERIWRVDQEVLLMINMAEVEAVIMIVDMAQRDVMKREVQERILSITSSKTLSPGPLKKIDELEAITRSISPKVF